VERREDLGARVARRAYQLVDAELDEGGQQHVKPRMVTVIDRTGRPVTDRGRLERVKTRGRAGMGASQAFDARGVQDGPHALG